MILTRRPELATGDYLKSVSFDGYLIDGRLLGIPGDIVAKYGTKVIVVNGASLSYEKGTPPLALPTPTAVPTGVPGSTPVPTPTPAAYSLAIFVNPPGGGTVTFTSPGGMYRLAPSCPSRPRPLLDSRSTIGTATPPGTSPAVTLSMDRNRAVVAYFRKLFP